MITADTITDEQIRGLMRGDFGPCEETRTMCAALYDIHSLGADDRRMKARARCAEILNARGAK